MLDLPRIKAVLGKAAYLDMDFPIFGSCCHTHLLHPPLAEETLAAWEELMQISLPADYRSYLTALGNGGAGPAYGISPFLCPLEEVLLEPTVLSDQSEAEFDRLSRQWYDYANEDVYELYKAYCLHTEEGTRLPFQAWDNQHWEECDRTLRAPLFQYGQLFLANQGCSHDVFLLLNGSHRGMCNYSNEEYDYSYPFWYEKAAHRQAITWPQYRGTLLSFESYLMRYVHQAEEVCASLSPEKKEQFHRERLEVLEFYEAIQEKNWDGVCSMLAVLSPPALSTKSRRFYLYYEEMLESRLSGRPEPSRFYQEMRRSHRYNDPESCYIQGVDQSSCDEVCPSFEAFLQSFSPPEDPL